MFKSFWADDSGAILTLELVLIATVVLLGVLTGLAALRDAIITEMADVGGSISNLDQSFVIHGATSPSSATANSFFNDLRDFGDVAGDPVVVNERCLIVGGGVNVVPVTGGEGVGIATP